MGRASILLTSLLVAAALCLPRAASAAPALLAPAPVIEAGGFVVDGPFQAFVLSHGGLAAFGQPLSDELLDGELGVPVQYFAYARLERHGDELRLARLGSLRAAGRVDEAPFQWLPADTPLAPGQLYVPESGHTLGGAFAWHHARSGGVALLGHPISEEFQEPQPDGTTLLVQYFERGLLSFHPTPAGGVVEQAPLGAWLAEQRLTQAERTPGLPLAPLASATLHYTPGTAWGANIELAAANLSGEIVEPGARLSFLVAVGEISAAAGYLPGPAVVGGEVVSNEVGGGICSVATLLYRAAWAAGLPVLERQGHSRWLAAYSDMPGLDAAIAAPGPDLRVRNDTGQRLYVAAQAADGVATVTLWGHSDGRSVELRPPLVREGELIEVVNSRSVRDAAGRMLRREQVTTRYRR